MCFSAEASFGASVVITTIGIITLKKAEKTPLRLLALIPVFFGIQQFLEGIVWLGIQYESFSAFRDFSTYGFIFFAWVIWPMYIPFTLWKLETVKLRKKMLLFTGVVGVFVTSVLVYIIFSRGVEAKVEDCSILYEFSFKHHLSWIFGFFYVTATVIPSLISSTGKMWILGLLNFATFFVSKIYYNEHIISVWCFFAAISSVVIWYVVSQIKKTESKIP